MEPLKGGSTGLSNKPFTTELFIMNQSQFADEVMSLLFGEEHELLSKKDCNYEFALVLIKNLQMEILSFVEDNDEPMEGC